ncbi:MAG: KH domain-containing protein [Collinsella sp.]|uniref:KH domain-containing protein n=1 Tax=unclassified Collinsella TaxID=2637548 RepID=UPI0025F7F734|nr:KH domain-containing protein [Collinsella sp.]MEE0703192.1 KH domain-containing protein [Collinsella sp.]
MSEDLISETFDDETVEFDEGEELVSDRIADLVEYLVVNIVDDADGVSLEVIDGASSSTIEVTVSEGDVAKVIGRHGRTIKAIRTLARALAARLDTSVEVEVMG